MTTTYRVRLGAILLAGAVVGPPARGDEAPETIREATAAATILVEVDPAILQVPKLSTRIRREVTRSVAAWKAEAEAERANNPEAFRDGRRWSFEQSYRLRFASTRWVSVGVTTEAYTGGAHGATAFEAINWDKARETRFGLGEILTETRSGGPALTALAAGLRKAVMAEKAERGVETAGREEDIAAALPADASELPPFTLEPAGKAGKATGLRFAIEHYLVGSYAEGTYSVVVPTGAFVRFIRPEMRGLFVGGER
ncbi:PdaC/SigV domain-containing protein [Prosthecomicrobium sp. N25]|uniref:PdaC/SigV domain-containing protein n=1 Tax=Prosthecomicrobium sp. N25 TaxID=3129254 RepID=UPI00307862ED